MASDAKKEGTRSAGVRVQLAGQVMIDTSKTRARGLLQDYVMGGEVARPLLYLLELLVERIPDEPEIAPTPTPPAKVQETDYAATVARARKLCGCCSCQGGYPIGGQTLGFILQNPMEVPRRPVSCLASELLKELL